MDYDKRLIQKAKGKPCRICYQIITETEADNCEFHYSKTTNRKDKFIHTKCWKNLYGKKVQP